MKASIDLGMPHIITVLAHHYVSYPDVHVGEDDLTDVMDEVMEVVEKWRALGMALRLKTSELDSIKSKNHTDPTECLRDTLQAWLQQRYDVQKYGVPSWDILCKAVKKPSGGNNPALADKIAKKYSTHASV